MKKRRNMYRSLTGVLALSLILSFALATIGNAQDTALIAGSEPEYATRVFGEQIISVEIIADPGTWQGMLDNAMAEEYIKVDVIVNGTKFQDVGIRPKGNSSLTQVANSESDRFSFRLQFDEYVKGQTCFGLDSFVLNNMFGDSTYMKEYISYELMGEIGVDAPYFGYASIKVNGNYWGLYLAVERYSKSYEKRVFGDTKGMLYNVKTMDMDKNDGGISQAGKSGDATIPPNMQGFMPRTQDPASQQPPRKEPLQQAQEATSCRASIHPLMPALLLSRRLQEAQSGAWRGIRAV